MKLVQILIIFTLLFCILFDPVVGTYPWLHYKKTAVKQEVQKQIDDGIDQSKLVLLKFTREEIHSEVRWEHAREFEYKHKMYDVVKTESDGKTFYYWCWYDHEETMLNRQIDALAAQAAERYTKSGKERALLVSNQETLYCVFLLNWNFSLNQLLNKPSGLFSHLYHQIHIQPLTPPPQFRQTHSYM